MDTTQTEIDTGWVRMPILTANMRSIYNYPCAPSRADARRGEGFADMRAVAFVRVCSF